MALGLNLAPRSDGAGVEAAELGADWLDSIVTARAAVLPAAADMGALLLLSSPPPPSSMEGRVEGAAAVAEAPRAPRPERAPLPPRVLPREDIVFEHWCLGKLFAATGPIFFGIGAQMLEAKDLSVG